VETTPPGLPRQQMRRAPEQVMLTGMEGTLIRDFLADSVARARVYPRVALDALSGGPASEPQMVAYGEHPRQHLLLFSPPEGVRVREVGLFFLHGGGWRSGDTAGYSFVGRAMAARGFVTAVAGYRLAPAFRFPRQLHDACSGFAVAQATSPPAQGGVKRWVVGGFSAGGHLAALVAFADVPRGFLSAQGAAGPSGLLSLAAPLDLSVYGVPRPGTMLHDLLGPGVDPRSASPLEFVRGGRRPACLLVQGRRDPHVPAEVAVRFARAVNDGRRPEPAVTMEVPWMHHADVARLFLESLPETERIAAWLDARHGDAAQW